jgi:hypothetical protein
MDSEKNISAWGSSNHFISRKPEEQKKSKRGLVGWIISIVVLILLIGGGVFFWVFKHTPAPSVYVDFASIPDVYLGKPFVAEVTFSNNSDKVLKNVALNLSLPNGMYFVGEGEGQRVLEKIIGDLGPGSLNKETFELITTDGEQSVQKLTAELRYVVAGGGSATFEEIAEVDVSIEKPVIGLELTAPEKVFSGENFEFLIKYKNETEETLKDVNLRVLYPGAVYQFLGSTEKPTTGSNFWGLGDISRGEDGEIVISGNIVGTEGSFSEFKVVLETNIKGEKYAINSQSFKIGVSVAPLSLEIELENNPDGVAGLGETVRYNLKYKNNSSIALKDVIVSAGLVGELFDFSTLKTNGVFNSLNNTLSWSAISVPELENLAPGVEGVIAFELRLKPDYPIKRFSDKNFLLKIKGRIESRTVPPDTSADKTVSVANLETKVAGKIAVDAKAFYRDAASGILNSGVYPPQVNKPTQFTVHWILKNYSTDVSGVRVSASLLSGAKFTGKIKSTVSGEPVYNSATKEVVWTIDKITAGKGVLDKPLEAIFQIEITPGSNTVGQTLDLLSQTELSAKDDFTGLDLKMSDSKLTTGIPDDTTIQGSRSVGQ